MLLKESTHKYCSECNHHIEQLTEDVYGCDNCQKELPKGTYPLKLTVFYQERREDGGCETKEFEFCCWKCVFEYIPQISCDYFISLPNLICDKREGSPDVEDFLKAINHNQ